METTNKVYTGTVPNVTYTSSVFNSVLYQTIPSNRTANYLTSYSRANTVFRKRNRISANRWGGLFLSGNGSLYSWGFDPNYSGPTYLLGRSSSTNSPSITTPVELALASDEQILQFVSGEGHHLVLTNKAIWGWVSACIETILYLIKTRVITITGNWEMEQTQTEFFQFKLLLTQEPLTLLKHIPIVRFTSQMVVIFMLGGETQKDN